MNTKQIKPDFIFFISKKRSSATDTYIRKNPIITVSSLLKSSLQNNQLRSPLFPDGQSQYYYPLLELTPTESPILLRVLFRSPEVFLSYGLLPFLTRVNGSLCTMYISHQQIFPGFFLSISFPCTVDLEKCHK